MSCARYEQSLFLYRRGELENGDAQALRAHLSGCKRCAALAATLEDDDRRLEHLRLASPRPADPGALTARVMQAVDRESMGPASALSRVLDRIVALTERPPLRYAAAGFACTVTAAFLVQQATLFLSVRDLEQRVAARSGRKPNATLVYTVEPEGFQELEELRPDLERALSLRAAGGTLVITTHTLQSYESILRDLQAPFRGSAVGARIDPEKLDLLLETVKGSLSVSLMLQTSEG